MREASKIVKVQITAGQHAAIECYCPGCGSVVHLFACVGVPHRTTLHAVEGHRFPRRSDSEQPDCEWSHAYVFVGLELSKVIGPTAALAEQKGTLGDAMERKRREITRAAPTETDPRRRRNRGGRFPLLVIGGDGDCVKMIGSPVVHLIHRAESDEADSVYTKCRTAGLAYARSALRVPGPATCNACERKPRHGTALRWASGCRCVRCEAFDRGVDTVTVIRERMAAEVTKTHQNGGPP